MTIFQPRAPGGTFDTTGATPHEKHRYHTQQAHLARVNAAIFRQNGETCTAENYEAAAATHDRLAAGHLAAALKT
jgi:hypothetical protein